MKPLVQRPGPDSNRNDLVLPPLRRPLCHCFRTAFTAGLISALGILVSPADTVKMTANDSNGATTSFNSNTQLHWSNGLAPTNGNAYFTTNFLMRGPNDGMDYAFQGDSLSVDTGGRFLMKSPNTTQILTVTNLILNGGYIDQAGANSDNNSITLMGGITVNSASSMGAIGVTANGSSAFETLDVAAIITGSAPLTIAGTINSGGDSGVVRFSAANPYSGTIQVSNNIIASTVNRLLQLNNLDAVSNATVNLTGSQASPMSFASAANTGNFNIGGVTGRANQTLNDTAGLGVTVRVGGNNGSTTYAGGFTGSGNVVKAGSGVFTLAGTNTFTGNTTISNGTLVLASGALLNASTNIIVMSGAMLDVSSNAFTLAPGQCLLGSGTTKGSVIVGSGASVFGGLDQTYGTNNFTTNLTFSTGAGVNMDLGTSSSGANDRIVVGGNLALNNTVFHIKAPGTSVNLDQTADYILMTAAGTLSGSPASTSSWDVMPLNAAHYSILKSGNNVVLHYNTSLLPQGYGVVAPNPAVRNQTVLITVTVTYSATPVSGVTVDATLLGSSNNVPLYADSGIPGNYTNSVVIPASFAAGSASLVATITDSSSPIPLAGTTSPFAVTVDVNLSETWSGGGVNDNWSANKNWQGGFAPGYVGDSLTFAGTTRLTPNMDADYSVGDLTFDGSAGGFNLGSSGGHVLTLTGGNVVNNSANTQTLSLFINATGNGITFQGQNNIVVGGSINGDGGLTVNSTAAVILNATNTLTGGILINGGTLQIGGAGLLGGTNGNYAGSITNNSVLVFSSSATQTLAGVISDIGNGLIKDGSGTLILGGASTYTGDTLISNGVLQVTGTLGGGNYYGNITDNGTWLRWSSASAQTLSGIISGSGGLLKDGSGTLTLNGANTYSGATIVNSGTLAYDPVTYPCPAVSSIVINGGGTVMVKAGSTGASLSVGSLTLNTNGVLNLNCDFSGGNPIAAPVVVLGSLSVPGTNIIRVTGFGAAIGQFPLVSYTGTPLANLNNFILSLPPGLSGNLVNNTASRTIDLNVTASSPVTWIPLNAVDAAGTSSFNSAGHWSDGNAPVEGAGYYTTPNYLLRSPADTNSYTFAGSALSIDQYGYNATSGRFLMKGPGGAVITVTNLILNGGLVDYANSTGDNGIETLAGNITLISGITCYLGALSGETLVVAAPIRGTSSILQIGGGSVNSGADTGVVALTGDNGYSGSTIVATGTLLVNGTAPNTTVTVMTNSTLGGTGSIGGAVAVQTGGTLAPGISAVGTMWTNRIGALAVGGPVSVSGGVTMKISHAATPGSDRLVAHSVTINPGATLTVNNIGSASLAAGDTFALFSTPVSGAFSVTNLPALPGPDLSWLNNLAVDGTIKVVSQTIPLTNAPTITSFSLAGNNVIIAGTNTQVGPTVYLLASTNVALPYSQWKTVSTNVLGGHDFIITGTNAVWAGASQQFFMLSSTNYNP